MSLSDATTRDDPSNDSFSDSDSDDSSNDEGDSILRPLITDRLVKSVFVKTPHRFIPEGTLQEIVTEEKVRVSLDTKKSTKIDGMVGFIMKRAMKVFSILVYMKLEDIPGAIKWLKRNGVEDSALPVKDLTALSKKSWGSEFWDCQWQFLAPTFSTTQYSDDLEESHILPFVSGNSDSGRGSFGVVSQYTVHRNHLKPAPSSNARLAVKEIQATEDAQEVAEHWEREVKALRTMNELNQENIVRFITAFRRKRGDVGQEHYLIFEWADGGNLRTLWKSMPSPDLTAPLIKGVVKQMLGLANALEAAHNLNKTGASYRHGDIKPENILVFSHGGILGTFKIGDWGEAREHGQATEMRPSKTAAKYGTRLYEAPEVETGVRAKYLGQSTKRRSRLYDIWAMGCITLELIIWLLHGWKGVNQLHNELGNDSFYQIHVVNGKKAAAVHSTVTHWMDSMAEDPRCQVGSTAIGDLLELVRTALLVVKLPRRLGTTLSDIPERPRKDSAFTNTGMEGTDITADGMIVEEGAVASNERPVVDIPSFTFTPAEPELPKIPVQPEPETRGSARCLATEFRQRLEIINGEDEDESYWYTPGPRKPMPESPARSHPTSPSVPSDYGTVESIPSIDRDMSDPINHGLAAPGQKRVNYASPELDENDWKFQSGNTLACSFLASLREMKLLNKTNGNITSRLCANCTTFRDQVLSPGFSLSYDTHVLGTHAVARSCDLCILLWRTVTRNGGVPPPTLKFDRSGPFLRLGSTGFPVLSVVRDPGDESPPSTEVQVGFVSLPDAGSIVHQEIVKHWLKDCDQNHKCAPPSHTSNGAKMRLPTRLLDVGVDGDDMIRLWATASKDSGEWVALSHKWGFKHLSTTPNTLQAHLNGIEFNTLPATFKDAVTVTRALGRQYLWIDSLCVIQGPDGDFATEAKRMEDVYSGAYCVIAASCAADHYAGFLGPRNQRDHVSLCREGKGQRPFHICQTVDNFKDHVLGGELHGRGWVLQEHALARRTLFFTEHQTYFECCEGVRCETSTMLSNKLAAFLGDPEFPQILSNASQGERILRYQELYRKYSRLGLSKSYDRPTAIDGLQQRLLRTMHVKGGFGIFDEGVTRGLLRRSLLWHRGYDTRSLTRIQFPSESVVSTVPSWSWMAYTGGIDYMQPEFGNFEWEDLESPWSSKNPENVSHTDFHTANIALTATAREYDLGAAVQGEGHLIFDTPNGSSMPKTFCVVLGKAKGSASSETRRHFMLIIAAAGLGQGGPASERVYERVGMGYLPGKCISPSGFSVRIH